MSAKNINLFDLVTVTGRLGGSLGKFHLIEREGADMTLLESIFSVGDNVCAFLDGKKQMADGEISKIYVIKSLKGNEVTVRVRTGSDFGFQGGIQGESGFYYEGGKTFGGPALTLEKADQVERYQEWFISTANEHSKGHAEYTDALDALALSFSKTNLSIETLCSDIKYKIKQSNLGNQ